MEKSSKRGKIPQQDWPSIIDRYESGETLASIARTYDCSPPAISYIVSRSRARSAAVKLPEQTAPSSAEPQLVKGPALEMSVKDMAAGQSSHGEPGSGENRASDVPVGEVRLIERPANSQQQARLHLFPDEAGSSDQKHESSSSPDGSTSVSRHGQVQRDSSHTGNGGAMHPFGLPGGSPQNGETRRRLHLPLPHGNGSPQGPGAMPGTPGSADPGIGPGPRSAQRQSNWQQTSDQQARSGLEHVSPPSQSSAASPARIGTGGVNGPHREKDGVVFIDQALRERVEGDIAAFLAAFDAALAGDTAESRTGLREATDRLLRAGARTRIELERLEARAPLPLRDKSGQHPPFLRR